MKLQKSLPIWLGAILGTCFALLLNAHGQAEDKSGQFTEEFHHLYPVSAAGRLELSNINGAVRITAWDRNEVKLDAIKYAKVKERLDEAKIVVDAEANSISIRTEYPQHGRNNDNSWDNPASVEYTLTVPRSARLDEIRLINGPLDISGSHRRSSCFMHQWQTLGARVGRASETVHD